MVNFGYGQISPDSSGLTELFLAKAYLYFIIT